MRVRRNVLIILGVLAVTLIGLRIALPSIIKNYVNDSLHALEEYDGSIQDVDLHLWRGAYAIHGMQIVKKGADQPTPFFNCDVIDLSIDWRSLFRGALVVDGEFVRPNINLVQAKNKEESQTGTEEDWAKQLREMTPFRVEVDELRVREGRVTFRAPGIRTQDAITVDRIAGYVRNISNVEERSDATHATFQASGHVLNQAPVSVSGRADPLAPTPTFDVNMKMENVQLPKLNPWLREYIKADAESGQFQLYMELAAADGKFAGYAKPLMQDVDIYSSEEPEKNPLRRLWEGIVDLTANVLENDEEDQVGARIPLSGTIEEPKAGVFETIVSVMRNAFVSAFARSLEGSISLRSVRENLSDLGAEDGGKKEEKKDKQDEKDEKEPRVAGREQRRPAG